MLINFTLSPLEDTHPWGELGNLQLHWFGLTEGQYWIEAGDSTLLEYSSCVRARPSSTRYCEYQVVRLYEDLLEMAPFILEPVPSDLTSLLSLDSAKGWMNVYAGVIAEEDNSSRDDRFWQAADLSVSWLSNRSLDTGYLSPSANIQMWSDSSMVHIEWNNLDKRVDDVPAWSADQGAFHISRECFMEEITSFHNRLMNQMSDRVTQVLAGALPESIQIDRDGLEREHAIRSRPININLRGHSVSTDWTSVRQAIHTLRAAAIDYDKKS